MSRVIRRAYGVKKGKAGVTTFFEASGSAMEVEEFTPTTFAANDAAVFTIVRLRGKARASGKVVDTNLHYFVFRGAKISYYRGREDSEQTATAFS